MGYTSPDWQPIATVPRDGTKVLLWLPKVRTFTTGWYSPKLGELVAEGFAVFQASHWAYVEGPQGKAEERL